MLHLLPHGLGFQRVLMMVGVPFSHSVDWPVASVENLMAKLKRATDDLAQVDNRDQRMGALVGANFNNDGTALYEAMAALFVAQMLGSDLTFTQQLMLVLTSVIASVGAGGIPEAGLVTMTLVFNAVGLPLT